MGEPRICRAYIRKSAAKRAGHAQCTNPAGKSGLCGLHEKVVMRREQAVLTQYEVLGKQLQVSPLNALLSLIYEAAGNVQFYRQKVTALERLVVAGKREREEINKLVVLYNEERDRLQRYTTDGLRVNLEAKQVKLYELQAKAIEAVARALIEQLGLSSPQKLEAAQIISTELKKFAADEKDDSQWQGPFMEAMEGAVVIDEAEMANAS